MPMVKINLKSLSKDGIFDFIESLGLPRYRGEQLIHWIYKKNAASIDEISEFSKSLRNTLNKHAFISNLELVKNLKSRDGTEKFLFSLNDGQTIETVLIPDKGRLTLCISSQVGCALGCRFCLTGKLGFIRNLKSFEIVDQITTVQRIIMPKKITNIVLMGMGEPLLNFDRVVEALWRIVLLVGISKRKITLSTAGITPRIELFSKKAPEVNLAVSLNATTDESRDKIMPVNKRYPIKSLLNACRNFPLSPRRRITFEYVLIKGLNDSREDALRIVRLLKGIRCKVNLIPLNQSGSDSLKRPSERTILEFQKILMQNNMTALIRESKGSDILAACGQLRGGS
ncbi:MAG: 23S rRNA (adenine(2503)-C(2))-methyltransferase RlmN [Nitrospirota bacterium]